MGTLKKPMENERDTSLKHDHHFHKLTEVVSGSKHYETEHNQANAKYLHACLRRIAGDNVDVNGNTTTPMAGKTSCHEWETLSTPEKSIHNLSTPLSNKFLANVGGNT